MKEHKYKLRYKLEHEVGEFSKEDVSDGGVGLTDALILFSILYPEDGSYSQTFLSVDGRTGKALSDNDIFKAWVLVSKRLADSKTLSPAKVEFASDVFESFRQAIMGMRK